MRIAICDDEKRFLDMICDEINGFYRSLNVACMTFTNGENLISSYEKGNRFDVVFLDIEMPNMDGMKTAEMIRRFSVDVPIIFLTSHTELAMDGYEVGAFRFLQKPVNKEKLYHALSDVRNLYTERKTLMLKENGEDYFLSPDDIVYVEADNNNVRFVTAKREFLVRMKLTEALKLLCDSADCFCRIHRCSIVHLGHIISRSDSQIKTDLGNILTVSKSYHAEFSKRLMEYVRINAR